MEEKNKEDLVLITETIDKMQKEVGSNTSFLFFAIEGINCLEACQGDLEKLSESIATSMLRSEDTARTIELALRLYNKNKK